MNLLEYQMAHVTLFSSSRNSLHRLFQSSHVSHFPVSIRFVYSSRLFFFRVLISAYFIYIIISDCCLTAWNGAGGEENVGQVEIFSRFLTSQESSTTRRVFSQQ